METTIRIAHQSADKPLMRRMYFYCDPHIYREIQALADKEDMSESAMVRTMIHQAMNTFYGKPEEILPIQELIRINTQYNKQLTDLRDTTGMTLGATITELLSFALRYYAAVKDITTAHELDTSGTLSEIVKASVRYNRELEDIGKKEGITLSETIGELLSFGVRYYKFKRGSLNASKPENSKTFYCQCCRQETSLRRAHHVQMFYEEFHFCEPCFFSDRYKVFLGQQINGV
jgi:hypothetical protein